jgi:hypothetical protein
LWHPSRCLMNPKGSPLGFDWMVRDCIATRSKMANKVNLSRRLHVEMRPDVVFLNFEKVNLWNHKNSLLFFSLFHQSRWANKLSVLEVFVKSSFIEPRACMEYGIKTLVCLTKI